MAVAPTGAIYKALEFDGVSSRTYGVYITGEAVYNAPERDVEMIAIPGRNGSFALDKGRFENIEVSYPAGIFADAESDFAEAVSDFRNFLCSRNGYVRLQDEYNPNEYRMAVYKSGLEVTPAQLKAGEFNITFECKPQRWLTSGESAVTVGEYQEVAGEDNAPYLFRSSPQFSDEYDTERDEIVGVSVGFNQLVNTTDTSVTVPSGHKYIAKINGTWSVGTSSGTALTVDGSNNDMVIDLTAMLGSTIADYIVTQGNTNGVAFFKRYFGADYYPYDSGSIRSVEGLVSHDMVGFNQWDEEKRNGYYAANGVFYSTPSATANTANVNPIKVVPNTAYYFKVPNNNSNTVMWYDADMNLISGNTNQTMNTTITSPSNACYMNFKANADYNADYDICINLSWDGSRDGEYEPYQKWSYPLDSTVTLRGLLKLEDGKLKADGDVYKADGSVTRKYGVVDLGSLTWTKNGAYHDGEYKFQANLVGIKPNSAVNHVEPVMCSKYVALMPNDTYLGVTGISVETSTYGYIGIHDSAYDSSTAEQFKTAMSGVYLVYPLATPTTDTAQPFAKTQKVSPSGTEEYVTTSVVPVGHETQYGQDPNVIVNPTLFEASPLLAVEGYGNMQFNGYNIEIDDGLYGVIQIAPNFSGSIAWDDRSLFHYVDPAGKVNDGDIFTSIMTSKFRWSIIGNNLYALGAPKNLVVTDHNGVTVTDTSVSYRVIDRKNIEFTMRTTVQWAYNGETTSKLRKIHFTSDITPASDSDPWTNLAVYINNINFFGATQSSTGNILTVWDIPTAMGEDSHGSVRQWTEMTNKIASDSGITADSTVTYLGNPTYIDCEIGEAYKEVDDEYISLNAYIDLGSKLPTFSPGANEVTFDNTVTDLKIVPRWWKI